MGAVVVLRTSSRSIYAPRERLLLGGCQFVAIAAVAVRADAVGLMRLTPVTVDVEKPSLHQAHVIVFEVWRPGLLVVET